MVTLDQIRALLPNNMHEILDPAIWNDREDGSIDHSKPLDAMDTQMRVHTPCSTSFDNRFGAHGWKPI